MPKGTSKAETNWGVEVNIRDAAGKQVYGADGKSILVKMLDPKPVSSKAWL